MLDLPHRCARLVRTLVRTVSETARTLREAEVRKARLAGAEDRLFTDALSGFGHPLATG